VYDVLGKHIATLVDKQQNPGNYSMIFDAINIPSGVYYYRLRAGSFVESKKMTVMK
jgi:hypothetical protein